MNDRRKYMIFALIVWWGLWGALIMGIPFKIGKAKMYSPEQGLGPIAYVGKDIKNVQKFSIANFCSFIFGNQPSRGPKGTTFDMVNKRDDIPAINSIIHNTTRFGAYEMVSGFYGPVNPIKNKAANNPAQMTKFVKDVCKYFGAVDVGICEMGPRPELWFFKDDGVGYPVHFNHEENKYAIVCLNLEEQSLHPFPEGFTIDSAKYYSKVAKNYWDDDYVAGQVAEMIRMMGYHANGHNNAYTRNVPLAIKAGLGEYGRFGNVITLDYGSNVRICTITTDLPLIPDKPVDIGVHDFCSMCTRCYDYCPMKAIPAEEMDFMGVHKWKVNYWRCRRSTVVGLDGMTDASTCTVCRDVCPFVKDTKYLGNKIGRIIVARSHIGRRFLLNLDYLLYSKWNRHGIGDLMKERRKRLIEANTKYPEGDWCKDWFTAGAKDPAVRDIYRTEKNKFIQGVIPKGGIGLIYPFYTEADLKDPTFGKWPTWIDPWGRTIEGYETGKNGAPRLDFRPVVEKVGTTLLSGNAGGALANFAVKGMPFEEAKKQPIAVFEGCGYDTAFNPWACSYCW